MNNPLSAHLSAAFSGAAGATVWMTQLELVFRIGLSAAGIVSAVYAAMWYREQRRALREKRDEGKR